MRKSLPFLIFGLLAIIAIITFSANQNSIATGQTSLSCAPEKSTVSVGESVKINASGGTGSYVWSAPGLILNNPVGQGFIVNYPTPGIKTITVTSGSQSTNCTLNVITTNTTSTPGIPNTGGGGLYLFK